MRYGLCAPYLRFSRNKSAAFSIIVSQQMKRFLFPIVGLWLLLYGSFALVRPPLLDDVDALHAEAAREMRLQVGETAAALIKSTEVMVLRV